MIAAVKLPFKAATVSQQPLQTVKADYQRLPAKCQEIPELFLAAG
jgi:hypothetical protein